MNKLSKKGLAAQKGKKAHAKASSKRTAAKKGSELVCVDSDSFLRLT